jgi:hypothetical protein
MNGLGEIFRLSVKSYGDALALVNRAGPTLFTALVVLAVGDIAGILAMRMFATELGKTLIGTLASIAALWFAAPYIVQLMRLLLEDQIRPGLESFTGPTVSARFFAWSGIFAFLAAIPEYVFSLAPPGLTPETADNPETITLIWVTFLLLVAIWIFTARTVTLLPAISLGRDITLVQAFNHTRGRFWFVMGAAFLPILPVLIVGRLLVGGTSGIVFIGLSLILALILKAIALVVSANLFRWLMENPK